MFGKPIAYLRKHISNSNCVKQPLLVNKNMEKNPCEFLFDSEATRHCVCLSIPKLKVTPINPWCRSVWVYGGGGYIQRLKGPIQELELKLQHLIENNWIDNRTRAIFVEFSVYNAQVRPMPGK